MALQLWETLKESITAYTGLSPTTFFTVVALALVTYYVFFGSSSSGHGGNYQRARDFEEVEPLPPPVHLGEITEEELKQYDGSDPKKPLLMAIKGQIYDVSQSRIFYGPGGPYALFAGKDASRALAKMSFEERDLTGDISGLGVFELEALQDWEYKFMSKYVKVGIVKKSAPVAEGTANAETSKSAEAESSKPAEVNVHDVAKPAEATDHAAAAAKPAEGPNLDVAEQPTEATDLGGFAKPVEGPPSDTAAGDRVERTPGVNLDKKE